MKTCGSCGEHKSLEEFANDKRTKSGKGSECKVCVRRRVSAWQKANPEKRKAQTALARERHREKRRADNLAYYYKRMAENPERVREIRRKYRNSPKGIIQARRSMNQHYYGKEVAQWWDSLVDPLCFYCDGPANEIDHIVPTSKGGTHELSNLVPACRRCNASKNDQDVEEFLAKVCV